MTRLAHMAVVAAVLLLAAQAGAERARLEQTVRDLASHGSRVSGYPGDRYAADYVEARLREAGVQEVLREPYDVVVPMDRGASLEVLGGSGEVVEEIPLESLWPNLVRTNTTGPEGLVGNLFYGGQGDYADLDGHALDGSVVLMEFNTWKNWKNAASLGAGAIVFVAPEATTLWEARHKWSWTPVEVPRFWLRRDRALALRQRLGDGELRVRVRARMDWERCTTWNLWGTVPGTDPELASELVLVQSYYDGISVVPADAPAAEAASGVAVLIELANYLKDHPPGRSVALLASGSHFLGQTGVFEFLDHHARTLDPFRDRMPKRFVADSLKVDVLLRQTRRRHLTPDSLGLYLAPDPVTGQPVLDSLDLERLVAQVRLRRIKPDSLGVRLEPDSLAIALFVALDLSSKSDQVGVVQAARLPAHRRYFVPLGRSLARHGQEAAAELGMSANAFVNLISPIRGLSWDSYIDDNVFREDAEIARDTGLMAVSLLTTTDARLSLDSPLDTPDRVNFANLERQSALVNGVLHRALADPELFGPDGTKLRELHNKNLKDVRVAVDGRLRLLPRRSATPDLPVPYGTVALVNDFYLDMWRPYIALADRKGNYAARGLRKWKTAVQGFLLDDRTGAIAFATDMGKRGQDIGAFEQTLSKVETAWTTILFPCESMEVHDRIHAHLHLTFGNHGNQLRILDKRGAAPRQFGWVLGDFDEQMMVLYGAVGDSLRLVDKSLVLLNNRGAVDEATGQGQGFDLSKYKLLPYANLQSAGDMWRLDDVRMERMRRFAIENPRLEALHTRARAAMDRAAAARDSLQWGKYIKFAREALGLEYRAYPDVRGTQNDVITGLVFFVALLVPAAFFAERLLFAAPDIRRQLAYFGFIMLVIWVILAQVHPAFELAHPVIVLLALMVMIMAFFVISLVVSRFNTFMTELRQRRSGTTSGDLSRSGTAYVAFMLGISNMRRRVLRTGLTLTTITLLTFTVLSFTSFKPRIQFVGFEKEWRPSYTGILMHDVHWWPWEPSNFDYLSSHFGKAGTVVPRTWITMGFEEEGYIPVRRDTTESDALGLLGMTVAEPRVTGIDRALTAGRWFRDDLEESVILADELAARLGIAAADLDPTGAGGPQVRLFGKTWRVVGIYDSKQMEGVRDLNNEPLTPAKEKFEQLNLPGMDQLIRTTGAFMVDGDVDIGYQHLPASRLAILPYHWLESMGAELMSVAVAFGPGTDVGQLVKDYLVRANFRLFVGMPDDDGVPRTYAYTSIGVTSMEGLGALIIPMLIAALIVLNTMMGAVYERFREIAVYSSVGLAPIHIAFLFIAEASVYGVLGVVLGYIIGQVGAKVLLGLEILGGVSLNYSSTSAISSAVLVILVVLASTIYPARVASQLAVPDVVRRWQLPEPDGDVWQFLFPFTVNIRAVESLCGYLFNYFSAYGHESVGKLYTERTRVLVEPGEGGTVRSVQLLLWLAPFDMGVSQYLQFTMAPT
ncbi:MAG: FtsX-like permease family protein, partial [Gemmatimonadota bacterium]